MFRSAEAPRVDHTTGLDRVEPLSHAASLERLRTWRSESLPIVNWLPAHFARDGRQRCAPVVYVQTKARADVRDLLRVQAQEGPNFAGDVWSQLCIAGGGPVREPRAFLHVRTFTPARCEFRLCFRLGRHRPMLTLLAQSAVVGITCQPPRLSGGLLIAPTLFVEVNDVRLLRRALAGAPGG